MYITHTPTQTYVYNLFYIYVG